MVEAPFLMCCVGWSKVGVFGGISVYMVMLDVRAFAWERCG